MKKMLTLMMALALGMFAASAVEAAQSAAINVTVTITASALDVSLDITSWPIGNILAGGTPDTIGIGPDYFTATNNRNASEDLTLTAASSGDWTAANTAGADQFAMHYSTLGAMPIWVVIDSVAGSTLVSDLAAGASETFDLQLFAPTSTSVGGTQQTIVVTVTAS